MTISLADGFKTPHAVVDWLECRVELKRNSHGGHLKRSYEHLGVSSVTPLNPTAGGAANHFKVRLQNPAHYGVPNSLLTDLDGRYELTSHPTLTALEVSVDFYHRVADISALRAMTERLMHSLTPPIPPSHANPRVFSDGRDLTDGTVPSRGVRINADKTLYVGNKTDDLMWRAYWKRTDDTYEGEDGKRVPKPLVRADWRARVEVCIQGDMLRQLDLARVADLQKFGFERLHTARLFRFARRIRGSGPVLSNPWSMSALTSFGPDADWPACAVNQFGRLDKRKRRLDMSRHLATDVELTEAARQALRALTRRFGRTV